MIFVIKPAEAKTSKSRFVSISKLNEYQISNGKSQSQHTPELLIGKIYSGMVNYEKVAQKKSYYQNLKRCCLGRIKGFLVTILTKRTVLSSSS